MKKRMVHFSVAAIIMLTTLSQAAMLNLAFLGIQTEAKRDCYLTVSGRVFDYFSRNSHINLTQAEDVPKILEKLNITNVMLTAEQANRIYNRFNIHFLVGARITEHRVYKHKLLKVLPFGYVETMIRYQLVIWNAMNIETRFYGEFTITNKKFLGYCGFGAARESIIYTADKEYFVQEKLKDLLVEDICANVEHGLRGVYNLKVGNIEVPEL